MMCEMIVREKRLSVKSMEIKHLYRVISHSVSHSPHRMQNSSQHNLNFIFPSPMSSFQPTAFPPAQPDDPNSPALFKGNIDLVQTQISTVRSLAHEALNAMYVLTLPAAR